jgi:hypothetical protein
MTPLQIASVIVIAAFVALLVLGSRHAARQRPARGAIRPAAQPPGGSAAVPGDHRAGGDDFRTDALATADDPIGGETTERTPA